MSWDVVVVETVERANQLLQSISSTVVVTSSYYNTGNYATRSKIEQLRINRLIICGWDNNSICWFYWLVVRNVWWGNQEILGEGNRHDNIDPLSTTVRILILSV